MSDNTTTFLDKHLANILKIVGFFALIIITYVNIQSDIKMLKTELATARSIVDINRSDAKDERKEIINKLELLDIRMYSLINELKNERK